MTSTAREGEDGLDHDADEQLSAPLPEAVRQRVVSLAADALGRMPADQLPPALKRVASFAPGRRAKLAGTQIASVLETDADFREHLGRQVRLVASEIATALDAGATPAAADPVEVAAVAYLVRPSGWSHLVGAAAETIESERHVEESRQHADQVDRLRRHLDAATEELKAARQRHREELARVKAENTDLRHKLGDARARLRSAEGEVAAAAEKLAGLERAQATAAAATEADARRLRTRIEELEAELAAVRRSERTGRGGAAGRAPGRPPPPPPPPPAPARPRPLVASAQLSADVMRSVRYDARIA